MLPERRDDPLGQSRHGPTVRLARSIPDQERRASAPAPQTATRSDCPFWCGTAIHRGAR
jgi:hypothetical protein